jgi:hypothetical protein
MPGNFALIAAPGPLLHEHSFKSGGSQINFKQLNMELKLHVLLDLDTGEK